MDDLEMDPLLNQQQFQKAEKQLLPSLRERNYDAFSQFLTFCIDQNPGFDVNRIVDDTISQTLLEIACCEGYEEFISFLLQSGANPAQLNPRHNSTSLHFATENGFPKILELLLEDPRTDPNVLIGQQSPLHVAIQKRFHPCIQTLLDHGADPNIPNSRGQTAMHLAANTQKRDLVDLILNHSKVPLDLDTFRDYRKQSARDILRKKFPDLQLPEIRTSEKVNVDVLRYQLERKDEQQFSASLKFVDSLELNAAKELIKIAAGKGLHTAVNDLLKRDDVETSIDMTEVIATTLENGHLKVLKTILDRNVVINSNEDLLLKASQLLGVPCQGGIHHRNVRLECFKLVLGRKGVNVRCEDGKGNTPLHYAARSKCIEAINLLLKAGSFIGHENAYGVSPLSHLSSTALSNYLDECLLCSDYEYSDEYEIEYDYRCFMSHELNACLTENEMYSTDPTKSGVQDRDFHPETKVLRFISKSSKLKHLLTHPLLSSFLHLKWCRISYIIYADFLLYLLFYLFLNFHIFHPGLDSDLERNQNKTEVATRSEDLLSLTMTYAHYLTLIALGIRSFILLFVSPLRYVKSFESWVDLTLLLLVGYLLTNSNAQVESVVILFSAWKMVVLVGQFPNMSTGIQMFKTVSWNFTKFLCLYAILIFSFSLSFYTLFKSSGDFPDPGHSLFRTIIMLTGEFDASSIPFMSYPILSHLIFVSFVFFITIVLFNLLNGLAVSDTSEILSKAQIVSLTSRTNLLWNIESFMTPSKDSYDCVVKSILYSPLAIVKSQIFLFPHYLPRGKIAVQPYKKNKITIPGKSSSRRLPFSMDRDIIERSKEILSQRGQKSNEEKIMSEFNKIDEVLKSILKRIEDKK